MSETSGSGGLSVGGLHATREPTAPVMVSCVVCQNDVVQSQLMIHLSYHLDYKPYRCLHCGLRLPDFDFFQNHALEVGHLPVKYAKDDSPSILRIVRLLHDHCLDRADVPKAQQLASAVAAVMQDTHSQWVSGLNATATVAKAIQLPQLQEQVNRCLSSAICSSQEQLQRAAATQQPAICSPPRSSVSPTPPQPTTPRYLMQPQMIRQPTTPPPSVSRNIPTPPLLAPDPGPPPVPQRSTCAMVDTTLPYSTALQSTFVSAAYVGNPLLPPDVDGIGGSSYTHVPAGQGTSGMHLAGVPPGVFAGRSIMQSLVQPNSSTSLRTSELQQITHSSGFPSSPLNIAVPPASYNPSRDINDNIQVGARARVQSDQTPPRPNAHPPATEPVPDTPKQLSDDRPVISSVVSLAAATVPPATTSADLIDRDIVVDRDIPSDEFPSPADAAEDTKADIALITAKARMLGPRVSISTSETSGSAVESSRPSSLESLVLGIVGSSVEDEKPKLTDDWTNKPKALHNSSSVKEYLMCKFCDSQFRVTPRTFDIMIAEHFYSCYGTRRRSAVATDLYQCKICGYGTSRHKLMVGHIVDHVFTDQESPEFRHYSTWLDKNWGLFRREFTRYFDSMYLQDFRLDLDPLILDQVEDRKRLRKSVPKRASNANSRNLRDSPAPSTSMVTRHFLSSQNPKKFRSKESAVAGRSPKRVRSGDGVGSLLSQCKRFRIEVPYFTKAQVELLTRSSGDPTNNEEEVGLAAYMKQESDDAESNPESEAGSGSSNSRSSGCHSSSSVSRTEKLRCHLCDKVIRAYKQAALVGHILAHVRRDHKVSLYSCRICVFDTNRSGHMIDHVLEHCQKEDESPEIQHYVCHWEKLWRRFDLSWQQAYPGTPVLLIREVNPNFLRDLNVEIQDRYVAGLRD